MNQLHQSMDIIDVITNVVDNAKKKAQTPNGYTTTIEINGYEFDAIVGYEIEPACKGGTGDYGMKTEPDSPAVINMGEVYIFDGKWMMIDVPEKAMTNILDEILEEYV